MLKLRDYQTETINEVYRSMKHGHRRIVVQQPPRTGKTVIMAEIAKRATAKGNYVMFVIHRKEVLDQAKKTFKLQGVKMSLTTMGMVQSLTRHVNEMPMPQLILIDEGHHAISKSYRRIIDAFPKAYVLYFTATPIRLGHDQMDKISDDIVTGKSIQWLTENHFLAPFKYYALSDIDRSKLKKSHGDFTSASMDQAIDHQIYGNIVKQYQRLAVGKQAVVYCHSIASAKEVVGQFEEAGISAEEVDGETPAKKRDSIVENFRQQGTMVLANVNLFTEGVDLPNVDCVIMARPTSSLSLYLQFSMRCLNPRKGKTAIIIDHVDNYLTHGLPDDDHDWSQAIVTKDKRKKGNSEPGPQICQCKYCFGVFYRKDMVDHRCPLCGEELASATKDYQIVNVDLQEIKHRSNKRLQMAKAIMHKNIAKNITGKSPSQLHSLAELQAYAQLMGYKPGWAYYQFKNRRK